MILVFEDAYPSFTNWIFVHGTILLGELIFIIILRDRLKRYISIFRSQNSSKLNAKNILKSITFYLFDTSHCSFSFKTPGKLYRLQLQVLLFVGL